MVRSLFLSFVAVTFLFSATPVEISKNFGSSGNGYEAFLDENGNADLEKVSEKLKSENLLNGFSKTGRTTLKFNSNSNGVLLLKTINLVLENLNFKNYQNLEFTNSPKSSYSVTIISPKVPNLGDIYREFKKHNIAIKNVNTKNNDTFTYTIDMSKASLDTGFYEGIKPTKPYFINVSGKKSVSISVQGGDIWYPEIRIYDKNLKLLETKIEETKQTNINLNLPTNSAYVQISDNVSLENIKNGLKIK